MAIFKGLYKVELEKLKRHKELERLTYIYVLADPRDGKPRYVGQAIDPASRIHQHLRAMGGIMNGRTFGSWLAGMYWDEIFPDVRIVARCSPSIAEICEMALIATYTKMGYELFNSVRKTTGRRKGYGRNLYGI